MLVLQMNEVNQKFFWSYLNESSFTTEKKAFINLKQYISEAGENTYEHLEPWIQWPTFHSGETFASHGMFRLGDCVHQLKPTLFDDLESLGVRYNAISPMNICCPQNNEYCGVFLPDPWSNGVVKADRALKNLFAVVVKLVNNNTHGKASLSDYLILLKSVINYIPRELVKSLVQLIVNLPKCPWNKALILDVLLFSIALKLHNKNKSGYNSVFLNACAHIQHHYWFNSRYYEGENDNPAWYIKSNLDPLEDALRIYYKILHVALKYSDDVLVATGLSQEAYPEKTIYWRPKDHKKFLDDLGCQYVSVSPRMSRDFMIDCGDKQAEIKAYLDQVHVNGVHKLFRLVEQKDNKLFVEVIFDKELSEVDVIQIEAISVPALKALSFVAVKNGHHVGEGFVLSTKLSFDSTTIQLSWLREKIVSSFNAP